MDKQKKPWYKRWWAITLWIILGLAFLGALFGEESGPSQQVQKSKPAYDLEMSMGDIFDTFSGLSKLQQEEKMKEFKGKRIKTSIYASKIDKASLSTQYVVLEVYEYPYNLLPYVKAFFPSEEKDNLLKANIGDTIIFSGEFVSYREGGLTSTVEFTNSRFIGIEKEQK